MIDACSLPDTDKIIYLIAAWGTGFACHWQAGNWAMHAIFLQAGMQLARSGRRLPHRPQGRHARFSFFNTWHIHAGYSLSVQAAVPTCWVQAVSWELPARLLLH